MTPIGNTSINDVTIPIIASADDFGSVLYFDSAAADGGDGSSEFPYNTLDVIMDESYPDNCALLLRAGSIFYASSLNADSAKSNVYFGAYDDGDMPIVTNLDKLDNPTQFVAGSQFQGTDITVDGIHFVGGSKSSYRALMGIGGTNLTIANSHLESICTAEAGYLFNIWKGGAQNMVVYKNEIAYAHDDLWYASSNGTYQIVSNYFHHANMKTYKGDNFDPQNKDTWLQGSGDAIQFEYPGLTDTYIANNFFDRSDSARKFALIFNGGADNSNVVIEHNTIIAPQNFDGGSAMQLHALATVRHNLFLNIDPAGGSSALASYAAYTADITNNDFVGWEQGSGFWNVGFDDLGAGNTMYDSLEAYQTAVPAEERLGSDIF
jgi:hypothetical protein